MRTVHIIAIIATLGAPCFAAPTRFPYWKMVKEVVEQIEARPAHPVSIGTSLQTPGQEYPFESFRHLQVNDLIRAAREGAQEARLQAALGKTDQEIDQQVLQNITISLEYLPLLMREDSDIEQVFLLMATPDEEPVLRIFLIKRITSSLAPTDLWTLSFREYIEKNRDAFVKKILAVASHPREQARVQTVAVSAYHAYLIDSYQRCLPGFDETIPATNMEKQLAYILSAQENQSKWSKETRTNLRRQVTRMEEFAEAISGNIAEGSRRDEQVKDQTRLALQNMRNTIAGINQDKLDAYLAGKPYADPNAFPAMPTMNFGSSPAAGATQEISVEEFLKDVDF